LTRRQWEGICKITGLQAELDALGQRLGLNLNLEGDRFKARHEITALLEPWFRARKVEDFAGAFDKSGVTWSVFRSFKTGGRGRSGLFAPKSAVIARVKQPGIGASYLVPGSPLEFGSKSSSGFRPGGLPYRFFLRANTRMRSHDGLIF
jgi:2-methylfumaryl-CoA isomerase